jgi:uncharacterized protein YbcI
VGRIVPVCSVTNQKGGQLPSDIHADDAAAMRDTDRHAGPLRQQLSNAVMALYKEYFGKGPVDCRAYLERDLVVLVLTGGYSAGEQTLFEAGKWHDVRHGRLAWQDSMEERFTQTIEQLTNRTVKAFLSASHQDPDVSVELFVLDETPPLPR